MPSIKYCFVLFLLVGQVNSADQPLSAFPGLKRLPGNGDRQSMGWVHVPQDAIRLPQPKMDEEDGAPEYPVADTFLDAAKTQLIRISYRPGPSDDPSFVVRTTGGLRQEIELPGLALYVPGNGSLYVQGHINNTFDQRRKITLEKTGFKEAQQPFLYVGLESVAKRDLKLYRDQRLSAEVATVAKGAKVQVVLNAGDFYLLKTPFGLLGWAKISDIGQEDDTLEGLRFYGD